MDSLCRVCIKRAEKCTPLNSKIEDSSNLSFLDFLNRCTSLNAGESDSLSQTLCSVCATIMKTFYSFVKLAEKSDIILREALENLVAKGRYKETSREEMRIRIPKIEEGAEDFNQGHFFHCQSSSYSTGPQLSIVKEEPPDPESTSIVDLKDAEINEGEKFESHLELPKEDSFHCQLNKNSTGLSLYTLDIVKEEPRLYEGTSSDDLKDDEINESGNFESKINYLERSIEEPGGILSHIDHRLGSLKTEYTDSVDDVPISTRLLIKRFPKYRDEADSQSNSSSYQLGNSCKAITHGCEICGKQFCTKLYLKEHLEYHAGVRPKCDQCGKEFTHNHSLRKHMKLHTNPKPLNYEKCEICGRIFSTKYYLNVHMESHGGVTQKCNQCGREYNNSRSLRNHMKWHTNQKAYACENCGKYFAWKTNYTRHMDTCRRPGEPKKLNKATVECKICGKKICSKQYLNCHMESHAGITQKCDQCGKEYKNVLSLRNHMKIHTNRKVFKCRNCGKSLSSKNNYTKHMTICKRPGKLQLKKPKFKCEICGKHLCTSHYLNLHMMKNHKIAFTHKCGQCGKEYLNAIMLRKHMQLHANPKPFKCENCSKSFAWKCNYAKHMELCKPADNSFEATVKIEKPSLHPEENKDIAVNVT